MLIDKITPDMDNSFQLTHPKSIKVPKVLRIRIRQLGLKLWDWVPCNLQSNVPSLPELYSTGQGNNT